jgi:hypothetical protein
MTAVKHGVLTRDGLKARPASVELGCPVG